jgi:hypothetical protein
VTSLRWLRAGHRCYFPGQFLLAPFVGMADGGPHKANHDKASEAGKTGEQTSISRMGNYKLPLCRRRSWLSMLIRSHHRVPKLWRPPPFANGDLRSAAFKLLILRVVGASANWWVLPYSAASVIGEETCRLGTIMICNVGHRSATTC